ncbi:MAG: tandem-95 repeat protein [Thermoanaerobaculia bacterium]|nr:tandem-95 repeat protein [Thermoanaerobaculia bacterium]
MSASVSGSLALSSQAGTLGRVLVAWDGTDGDASTVDPSGLGSVDLTAGGRSSFRLAVGAARAGTEIEIRVYSDAGANISRISRALPETVGARDFFFDFSDFTADTVVGADFAAAGAVTLRVTGTDGAVEGSPIPAFTATLFETAVPNVGALKVDLTPAGAPLPDASPGDTVRYRITITNTGATAQGVDLADTLDPNLTLVAGSLRTTPVARPDAYKTLPDTTLDSSAAGRPALLANDSDADGDGVAAVAAIGIATLQGGAVDIGTNGHFVYTPPTGFTGPDSFSYTLQATSGDPTADTSGAPLAPVSATATVVVERIPPTLAPGGPATFTEDGGPVVLAAGLAVSAPDSPTLSSATVTITNLLDVGVETLAASTAGTSITASYVAPTLTLSGSDTTANYQQVLRSVTYDNGSQDPNTAARSLDWTASDPFGPGGTANSTVSVSAVNDAPVVTAGGTLAYTENDPATAIDPALTVTDADHADLVSATVQITGNYQNGQDVLSFTDTATITGVFTPATGVLALTGSDTVANWQAALRAVGYANTSENPSTLARTVTWIASDGTDASAAATSTILVTATNDAPVVTAGGTLAYTENDPATAIDPALTVTDADHANLVSATVQITGNYQNGQDVLSFTDTATITGVFTPATGVLALTGSDTVANWQTALRAVGYANTSENPSTLARTVTWIASDGADASAGATSTILVTAVNDAPVVTAGGTLAYTENDPATGIDTTITVSDADHASLQSATVQITANYANGQDVLSFTNTAFITGVFTPATGTLTLTGSDTVANWQTALRAVRYANSSENPSTLARTVTWIASDGTDASAGVTSTINVIAVNDAPVVTATGGVTAFIEDGGAVTIDSGLTVTDADSANLASAAVTITNPQDGAAETLAATSCAGLTLTPGLNTLGIAGSATVAAYQTCLRSVTYDNSSQNPGTTTRVISFVASDGTDASAAASKSVSVTAVNDAPFITTNPISYATPGNTQLHVEGKVLAGVVAVTDAAGVDAKAGPFTDPDGPVAPAILDASGASANGGSYDIDPDGSFTYVPPVGFTGTDSFTYQVTDTLNATVGTVNIEVGPVVWYVRDVVDANNPAGGDGRSTDAFETLAAAESASAASQILFVFRGDTGTTPLGGGIALKNGQKLWGEGIGLTLPSFGTLVPAGSRPVIGNTTVGGNGVTILANTANGNRTDVEVRGLSLSGHTNAVDVTAANAASVAVTISDNDVTAAGLEGIDLNAGSTGTFSATVGNNALAATGNAFDARTSAATTMTLDFSDNVALSSGAGTVAVYVEGATGGGTTRITGFSGNAVSGSTAGSAISVAGATFDATPGGAYQTVSGGTTLIGDPGNGVGGAGIVLSGVAGDLAFTDLDVFAAGGAAVSIGGTGAVNTASGTGTRVTVATGVAVFEATGGPAVSVSNATIDLQPTSIKSTNSSTTGISLTGVADGTVGGSPFAAVFSAGSGSSIGNATGTAFNVDGGNATITYSGTITNSAGRSVSVTNRTADSVTLSGAITDTGTGIFLNANTGSTIAFSAALSLTTGANDAFTATGGGTVTATDTASTITTTTGRAINVANTTIGAGGLKFRSVSAGTAASGPPSGIVLNNTGSSGGLAISGTGGGGTGGTIQRSTGPGISLTDTTSVSLSHVTVSNGGDDGIRGSAVTGLSLTGVQVLSNGNAAGEAGIELANLSGSSSWSNVTVTGSAEDNVVIRNSSGTLNGLTVTGSTFSNNSSIGNDGFLVEASGTASITVSVTGSTFTANRGDHFQAAAANSGTLNVVFSNNTLSGGHATALGQGVTLNAATGVPGWSGTVVYDIAGNTISGAISNAVSVVQGTSASSAGFTGKVRNNIIGTSGVALSCSTQANGVYIDARGNGTHTSAVTGNTIRQCFDRGILSEAGDGDAVLNLTVTGNVIDQQVDANAREAFQSNHGITSTNVFGNVDSNAVCLQLGGAGPLANTLSHGGGAPDDFRLRKRHEATVRLPGYAGGTGQDATSLAQVVAFIQAQNTGSAGEPGSAAASGAGGGYTGGAACPTPP